MQGHLHSNIFNVFVICLPLQLYISKMVLHVESHVHLSGGLLTDVNAWMSALDNEAIVEGCALCSLQSFAEKWHSIASLYGAF